MAVANRSLWLPDKQLMSQGKMRSQAKIIRHLRSMTISNENSGLQIPPKVNTLAPQICLPKEKFKRDNQRYFKEMQIKKKA